MPRDTVPGPSPAAVGTLRFPPFQPESVRVGNRLRGRSPVSLRLDDTPLTIACLGAAPGVPESAPRERIALSTAGAVVLVETLEPLLRRLPPFDRLPAEREPDPASDALLLSLVLDPALTLLERQLGAAIAVTAVDTNPSEPAVCQGGGAPVVLALRIAAGDRPVAARMHLGSDLAARLESLWPRPLPWPPRPSPRLPLRLALRVATVTAGLDDLRRLGRHDVILVDGAGAGLVLAEQAVWPGKLRIADGRPDALVLTGGPRRPEDSTARERSMETRHEPAFEAEAARPPRDPRGPSPDPGSAAGDAQAGILEDVPMTLVFEVGSVTLPLAEIGTLGPGHVFPLGPPGPGRVTIRVNGRRLGHGDLVMVGDAVGVRLDSFAGRDVR